MNQTYNNTTGGTQSNNKILSDFSNLYQKYKNDPLALSQMYQIMNYKPLQNTKYEPISTESMAEFLQINKGKSEFDIYDDILYYDEAKIKQAVMKQQFLISQGLFDAKQYFPSIQISSLQDTTFDEKIKDMLADEQQY